MKREIITCMLGVGLVITTLQAEQQEERSTLEKEPHRFSFGIDFLWINIDAKFDDLSIFGSGFTCGPHLEYEYLKPNSFYANIAVRGSMADKSIFSAKQNDLSLPQVGDDPAFGSFFSSFGYTFGKGRWLLSPYMGIGGYDIDDFDNLGFEEFLPLIQGGVKGEYSITPNLQLGGKLSIFRTFSAHQKYVFGNTSLRRRKNMWGGEFSLPLTWKIGARKNWDLQLAPTFIQLDFSQKQRVYGFHLTCGYHF